MYFINFFNICHRSECTNWPYCPWTASCGALTWAHGPRSPISAQPLAPSVSVSEKLQKCQSFTTAVPCLCMPNNNIDLDCALQTDFTAGLETCLITVIWPWFLINLMRPDPDPNIRTDLLASQTCLGTVNLLDVLALGPPLGAPSACPAPSLG